MCGFWVWLRAGLCQRLWSFWVLDCIQLNVELLGLAWLGAGLCERLWSFWVLDCIKLIVGLLGLAWGWLLSAIVELLGFGLYKVECGASGFGLGLAYVSDCGASVFGIV